LSDWRLVLFLGVFAGMTVVVVLAIVAAQKIRARRAEFARMREDIKRLSEDVKYLMNAEQRRFLMELKSPGDANEVSKSGELNEWPKEQARST
jgi:hypothetical protein